MHLLLRTTFLLRLVNVMRVDACERHSEYSRVVHGLVAPRSLSFSFKRYHFAGGSSANRKRDRSGGRGAQLPVGRPSGPWAVRSADAALRACDPYDPIE